MAVVVAMEVAVAEAVAVLTAAAGAPGPAVSLTAAIASICVEAIASAMAASREAPGVVSKRQLSHHVHCHVQMQIRRRHEPCLHPNAPTPALRIIDIGRLGWGCRGAALSEGA